jgi:ribonuclease P protein component
VIRNKVRRRLKEAVRYILPHEAQAGHVYVFIGTMQALNIPFTELVKQMSAALHKSPIPQDQLKLRRKLKHKK